MYNIPRASDIFESSKILNNRTFATGTASRQRTLLLKTSGPVLFGTCICSNVETILSWTCHISGPFEFRTSLGTSILLYVNGLDIDKRKAVFVNNDTYFWPWTTVTDLIGHLHISVMTVPKVKYMWFSVFLL